MAARVQVTAFFSDVGQQRLHTSSEAIDEHRHMWRLNSPTRTQTHRGNEAIMSAPLSDVERREWARTTSTGPF
ncbi:Hypothetical predicted protein [Scomber scombrus]|uniref:Uncharacterized protein n=1 Tax=Scomber scombrus TaxID=13677 RepID=A0AAV1NJY3_SCOSC